MTEEPIRDIDDLPTPETIKEPQDIYGDYVSRGTRMIEMDSYDRVIEGLKLAADRARHLAARREDDNFRMLATLIDKMRDAAARQFGLNRSSDRAVNVEVIHQPLPRKLAYEGLWKGLDGGAKAAHQIAACWRGELWWTAFARGLEKLRDQARQLAKVREDVTAQVQRYNA